MDASQIETLPGFNIMEHEPGYTILTVPSGFTLRVNRIGPYIFRQLDKREDLRDPGPFTVKIKLMQKINPPGIEIDWEYEMPDEMPDREEHPQAWAWWHQNLAHRIRRQEISIMRNNERTDMMLLAAVVILDGPISMDDEDWLERLLSKVDNPSSRSERLLLFYQTQVITTRTTADVIQKIAVAEEVTIQGLKLALDSFRSQMAQQAGVAGDG